jgi:hypothetical protein
MRRMFSPVMALLFLFGCLLGQAQLAQAQDETKKISVYGMLRQSPQGGIELVSAQEPGVVYVPFDRGSIMGTMLDIKVRVRGVVRDIEVRGGTTYKVLAVDEVTPLTAEYGATVIERDQAAGLPGTDAAEVHRYHDRTCYFYPRYAVVESLAGYSDGHVLRVSGHTAADSPDAVCELAQGTPLFEIPNGGDFAFAGLSGDTLLVTNGATNALHGLMAVNLAVQKQTLDATVAPGERLEKGQLVYAEKLPEGRKSSCAAGKTAMRTMRLDLKTGKASPAGKDICWP